MEVHSPFTLPQQVAVARQFDGATLAGTLGTPDRPGVVTITMGRDVLATGPTFEAALESASRRASELTEARA